MGKKKKKLITSILDVAVYYANNRNRTQDSEEIDILMLCERYKKHKFQFYTFAIQCKYKIKRILGSEHRK